MLFAVQVDCSKTQKFNLSAGSWQNYHDDYGPSQGEMRAVEKCAKQDNIINAHARDTHRDLLNLSPAAKT